MLSIVEESIGLIAHTKMKCCCITAVLRVREVFPGSSRVLRIQVDNNYISLPGELFENLNESGIELHYKITKLFPFSVFVASFYFENVSHLLPGRK